MLLSIPLAGLLLDILLPYVLSLAIGTLGNGQQESLSMFLWIASGIGLAGVALNLIGFQAAIGHESAVRKDLVDDTLSRLLVKDQDFFANQKIGALTGKFIDFINSHVALQDLFIIQTIRFILSFGVGIVLIFMQTSLLGIIVLLLLIGLLIQVRTSLVLRKPLRRARREMVGELNGATADIISNNLTVKTFAREDFELDSISKLSEKYKRVYTKDFRWMSIEGSGRLLVMTVVQIIAIAVMAGLLQSGQIELGIAIFTVAYLQRVAGQIFSLGEMLNGYDKVFLQAGPMTDILMTNDRIIDSPDAKDITIKKGRVEFKNVNYAYPDNDNMVINDFNLSIKPGTKIGVVGKSGAGKTTLTRLLLRFDDIANGELLIDGHSVKNVTQSSIRQGIAHVPQDPMLFHRSLRENISYGKIDATDSEILEAARKANALEFIKELPEGIDTIVGERGVKLSGGQRQRIAIARAILKDAPILILDEATSALDSESEKLIQDALEKLMKGRTSIVIAHRLSTIAKLDRIIVLSGGKIVEDGTHAQLVKQNGTYAKLWNHQSGGFIEG